MSDDVVETERYEPPTIEERVPVSLPLIGVLSPPPPSAAFRRSPIS
jgi:hypothetical protein